MQMTTLRKGLSAAVSLAVIFLLLSSFALHSVQIPHDHLTHASPQDEGNSGSPEFSILGEYMHASDKKLFLFITSVFLLGTALASFLLPRWSDFVLTQNSFYIMKFNGSRKRTLNIPFHTELFFARGILNPKLY